MAKKVNVIKGHPNCRQGECYDTCHNVSCSIYQGYEEPEYIEQEVEEEEGTEK